LPTINPVDADSVFKQVKKENGEQDDSSNNKDEPPLTIQMTKMMKNHLTPHNALKKMPNLTMTMMHPYLWLLVYLLFWILEEH
jgi:hypothetical protein